MLMVRRIGTCSCQPGLVTSRLVERHSCAIRSRQHDARQARIARVGEGYRGATLPSRGRRVRVERVAIGAGAVAAVAASSPLTPFSACFGGTTPPAGYALRSRGAGAGYGVVLSVGD
jgi:hypothetical protein